MELVEQARRGELDEVKRLLQQHVDVNTTNHNNQTALYCACESGHTDVAQYLLDYGADVNFGAKPLIPAVRNGHYDCVEVLLDHGASISCTNRKREKPMSVAFKTGRYSIILLLLQYNATPSASLRNIALQLLQCAKVEHTKTILELIDGKVIDLSTENMCLAAFNLAFQGGSFELAERMLLNNSYLKSEQLCQDAAYYSAKNNWPTLLSKLIEEGVHINALTGGQTPLYAACKQGHEYVVILLLNKGADPNLPNKITTSASKMFPLPIQIAAQQRNAAIFSTLLEKGAKVDQGREPLLHIACSDAAALKIATSSTAQARPEDVVSIIRLLLQQGVNVNAISDMGDTALHRACKSEHLQVVKVLLEAGADVNLTSKRCYPLMSACETGNFELINVLVVGGADVKCSNSKNETCLHAFVNAYSPISGAQKSADSASKSDIENTFKLLLESGVDVNAHCSLSETALYRASKSGLEHIVRLLLESGAEIAGSTSRRPLYAACESGHVHILDLLLQHGADANASTVSSRSSLFLGLGSNFSSTNLPISCAVKKGYIDIVELLLKHGADANKPDQSGKSALIYFIEFLASRLCKTSRVVDPLDERNLTILKHMFLTCENINKPSYGDGRNALHIASSFGMCDVIKELIECGADCSLLTSSGKSALYLACENGHEAAVEMLLKNDARPDIESATNLTYGQSSYDSRKFAIGLPVLCTAATNGSETLVKMLVQYGADVNASDEKGNTALHLSTSRSVIEALLNTGANVNATNSNGDSALSIVCERRQKDMIQCFEVLQPRRITVTGYERQQVYMSIIEMLFKFGANPNVGFPLHTACKNNDVDAVQLLLAYGADANQVKELRIYVPRGLPRGSMVRRPIHAVGTETSPLCIACTNGNVAIVDCLLQNGADTMFADDDRNSPLHFAVERVRKQRISEEQDPIIALLLQHKAPVNVVSNSAETPLYMACMKGLVAVSKQLLSCGADVGRTTSNSNKYPLMIACQNEFRDIAVLLLECGADANVSKDHQTPLKLAAANGDIELAKQLITYGADVNQMRNIGDTALHTVIGTHQCRRFGDDAVVKMLLMLLKSGAEINALNNNGETPLYLACRGADNAVMPNVVIAQTLLEHGGDPNICPPCLDSSVSRYTALPPLSAAVYCGNIELVLLLIKFGARLNHADIFGGTALHYAIGYDDMVFARHSASTKNDTSLVEALLSAGADINALDSTGASPLFLACDKGKTEFVKLLLSRGANPSNGIKEKLPIHTACRGHHYDLARLLLEYKADVTVCDENGKTALHLALESMCPFSSDSDKEAAFVQLLLEAGANVNVTSENGESPVYVACSKGLISIAKKLLEFGAVVDVNNGGKLPLIAACRRKHVSVAQLLLANGADPNAVEEGNAPLHIAARDDHNELVELLLKHGAEVDVADTRGNTALHLAMQRYHPTASSRYAATATDAYSSGKSTIDILLENKADVNTLNSDGETALYMAVSRKLLDVVRTLLQVYGGNPNKGSPDKNPLVSACLNQDTELVDILLDHGSDPNLHVASPSFSLGSSHTVALFAAVDRSTCHIDIITSLLNAGADVSATDHEGRNVACFATKRLTGASYCYPSEMSIRSLAIRLLVQNGANISMLLRDGNSPFHLLVSFLAETGDWLKADVLDLLQFMVEHGAILMDPPTPIEKKTSRQAFSLGTLAVLATFDCKRKFVVDLFRAGSGFQLLASCCRAVRTSTTTKSIALCQAVVFAGYVPNAQELANLQSRAATENTPYGLLLKQLVGWLSEDRRQIPSLFRQCRVAIRRQLTTAAQYRTILPAIEQLPLPNKLKLYLQFDGSLTEVDLSVEEELRPQNGETDDETFAEDRYQLYPYNYYSERSDYAYDSDHDYAFDHDYDYDVSDSDSDYYYNGYDSDHDRFRLW